MQQNEFPTTRTSLAATDAVQENSCELPARIDLSPGDMELLDEIRSQWELVMNRAPSYHEIIDTALRSIQRELDSPKSGEVIEELEREIVYRQWCATNVAQQPHADKSAERRPHSRKDRGLL